MYSNRKGDRGMTGDKEMHQKSSYSSKVKEHFLKSFYLPISSFSASIYFYT
jgi:hypothetical protein